MFWFLAEDRGAVAAPRQTEANKAVLRLGGSGSGRGKSLHAGRTGATNHHPVLETCLGIHPGGFQRISKSEVGLIYL